MAKFDLSDIKKDPKKNLLQQPKPKKESSKKATKPKIGRPAKSDAEKLSRKITLNLTEAEFNKLKQLAEKSFNIPLPKLIRSLLKQDGYI